MPLTPAPEEVFTIAPPPCLSSKGISYFMHTNTLRRFTRTILFGAGVVEGEIEASERFDPLVQSNLDVLGPRHIAPDGERPPAEFLDHACRFLIAPFRNVGDHYVGAFAGERQRGSAANAVRYPGYKGDLPRKPAILAWHYLLLFTSFAWTAPSISDLQR